MCEVVSKKTLLFNKNNIVFQKNIVFQHVHFYWLAVHGKPVLFWKGISGLQFPAFYFMHANGDGNHSSFGRFRYYYVNYRTLDGNGRVVPIKMMTCYF